MEIVYNLETLKAKCLRDIEGFIKAEYDIMGDRGPMSGELGQYISEMIEEYTKNEYYQSRLSIAKELGIDVKLYKLEPDAGLLAAIYIELFGWAIEEGFRINNEYAAQYGDNHKINIFMAGE